MQRVFHRAHKHSCRWAANDMLDVHHNAAATTAPSPAGAERHHVDHPNLDLAVIDMTADTSRGGVEHSSNQPGGPKIVWKLRRRSDRRPFGGCMWPGRRGRLDGATEGGETVGPGWSGFLPPVLVAGAILLGFTILRPPRSAAAPASPTTSSTARVIYLRDCAVCHGGDATGTSRGPTLQGLGRAWVDYELTTGRMPLLPNFRPARSPENRPPPGQVLADPSAQSRQRPPAYTPEVIAALEDYIASIAPGGQPIPSVEVNGADLGAGGEVFRLQCAACHEWAGVGGALYGRAAPDLHHATANQIAEAVRIGPGQMPAFGTSAIPAGRLSGLVAYVRYLDRPDNRGGNPLWYLGPVAEGAVAILVGLGALLAVSRWIGDRS